MLLASYSDFLTDSTYTMFSNDVLSVSALHTLPNVITDWLSSVMSKLISFLLLSFEIGKRTRDDMSF